MRWFRKNTLLWGGITILIAAAIVFANLKSPNGKQTLLNYFFHHQSIKVCKYTGPGINPAMVPESCSKLSKYARYTDNYCRNAEEKFEEYLLEARQIREVYFGIPITKQFCPKNHKPE